MVGVYTVSLPAGIKNTVLFVQLHPIASVDLRKGCGFDNRCCSPIVIVQRGRYTGQERHVEETIKEVEHPACETHLERTVIQLLISGRCIPLIIAYSRHIVVYGKGNNIPTVIHFAILYRSSRQVYFVWYSITKLNMVYFTRFLVTSIIPFVYTIKKKCWLKKN